MAVTTEKSTQFSNFEQVPPVQNPAGDDAGRVRVKYFDFTQGAADGDADSLALLARLPGGKVRVLQSHLEFSAFGAGRTLDLGHYGYTDSDDNAIAADPDYFASGIDVAAAGTDQQFMNKSLTTPSGFTFTAQVKGGTIPAAATIEGWILYVVD